jgi:hypothetical protein
MKRRRQKNSESGMAMILVITIMATLLAVGAVGLSLQLNDTKTTRLVKSHRASLFCAESGLAAARNILTSNRSAWNDMLDDLQTGTDVNNNDPAFYKNGTTIGITGDIDVPADGEDDYVVTIRDDGDDTDFATDSNDTIIVESTCTKFSNAPATVIEVISMEGQGNAYRNQSGQGPGNTGNAN